MSTTIAKYAGKAALSTLDDLEGKLLTRAINTATDVATSTAASILANRTKQHPKRIQTPHTKQQPNSQLPNDFTNNFVNTSQYGTTTDFTNIINPQKKNPFSEIVIPTALGGAAVFAGAEYLNRQKHDALKEKDNPLEGVVNGKEKSELPTAPLLIKNSPEKTPSSTKKSTIEKILKSKSLEDIIQHFGEEKLESGISSLFGTNPADNKKIYKKLTRILHPDKNFGNEEKATKLFQHLAKAYKATEK